MNTLTQKVKFRQAVVSCFYRLGITKACYKYNVPRATVYRWVKRYDGTERSLCDRSRRPHHHPNQHCAEELKLISDMRRRNPEAGLVVFWVKLMQRGYKRSIPALWRVLKRMAMQPTKPPNPKYIPKQYEKMRYPGQRVQVDVKYVPKACIVGEDNEMKEGYYQYTALDEYSRFRILWASKEFSTYSSVLFVEQLIKSCPFKIECIQTDNGPEFTNRFTTHKNKPSLFETRLKERGIQHKLIKPHTPRHNGKVERSHRKDNEYFYATHSFYSFEDFKLQLQVWNRQYNKFPMRPLNWHSPADYIHDFLQYGLLH